ncbi:hypothetical protein Q7C36_020359 [Tachysurus vachellii]|uniref:Uncharacterized protein n=1 Tax=Tachysurus vachellii TaxID=175792 RepID=A0AA88S8T1_TACVA|nr:hypothetical protein Q7C36_020359 [Tachysurus vachellii]
MGKDEERRKVKETRRWTEKQKAGGGKKAPSALVWNAQSSWARAAIAMETTEQEGCWPWKMQKKRLAMKRRKRRRLDENGDTKKDIMMDVSEESRNLPSKVGSVKILSPKPAICNVMRCLAGLIRPLALC